MSNKSQLQLNNTDLQSILSTVLGLPTQESVKHGAYVWKKCNKIPGGTITITQLTGASNPTILQLTSSDIDLSSIDASFFIGVTTTLTETIDHEVVFKSATTLTIDGTQYTYSYDSVTARITINSAGYADNYWYSISREEVKLFVDFVVSDQSTAYPDGGTQDGYWYDKVVEGVDLLAATGCTKIAVDKFTPSANTAGTTALSHSLGEIPRIAILLANTTVACDYTSARLIIACRTSSSDTDAAELYMSSGYSYIYSEASSSSTSFTGSTVTFGLKGYQKGLEYTLITMA